MLFRSGQFDQNKCRLTFSIDGRELFTHDYTREGGKGFHQERVQDWTAGEHVLTIAVTPLTPEQMRDLQVLLKRGGYSDEEPDGKLGQATRIGTRKAQAALGLPADGYPSPELLAALQRR